jgi:hypothetical protein
MPYSSVDYHADYPMNVPPPAGNFVPCHCGAAQCQSAIVCIRKAQNLVQVVTAMQL